MTYQTPCRRPENDPDHWFISRDGKQYEEDDLLTQEAVDEAVASVTLEPADEGYVEAVDKALDRAEGDAKRQALQKRRHAKEACFSCYLRTNCLDLALRNDEMHGTWGGYYEEELKEIRRERDRRRRKRNRT